MSSSVRPTPPHITIDGLLPVGDSPTERRRAASRQLAPERCVRHQRGVVPGSVTLIGRSMDGTPHVRIELSSEDAAGGWWQRALRLYLALRYGATEIQLVRDG